MLLAIGGGAGGQATFTPDDRADFTPQFKQALSLKALDASLRHAAGNAGDAACLVLLWYRGDGTILAAQLTRRSGYPGIDQACLAAVIGQKLKPPSLLQPELGGWVSLPIHWVFVRNANSNASLRLEPDPSIPAMRGGDPLDLTADYYPEAALAQRAHGICKLHVTISAAGDVDAIEVTQSTGSAELDQACRDTIYDTPFMPARQDGKPVSGTTDVALDWRLPASVP
jgi:TonB family protein